MYLTVHAVAGALIGHYVNEPIISFVVGFISHFFLDMLPHYDTHLPKDRSAKEIRKQYFNKIFSVIYIDISLTLITAVALFTNNIYFLTQAVFWGMVGAILPDILQLLSFIFKNNWVLKQCNGLHNLVHYSPESQISIFLGHVTQLITLIILIRPLV
jgi:hypothetical protein